MCMFITAVPITKMFAWEEGDRGGVDAAVLHLAVRANERERARARAREKSEKDRQTERERGGGGGAMKRRAERQRLWG
jgi:hypothetical protein